jgi:hypothetical protein
MGHHHAHSVMLPFFLTQLRQGYVAEGFRHREAGPHLERVHVVGC